MNDFLSLDISNADLENLDVFLKKLKEQNPELDIAIDYYDQDAEQE